MGLLKVHKLTKDDWCPLAAEFVRSFVVVPPEPRVAKPPKSIPAEPEAISIAPEPRIAGLIARAGTADDEKLTELKKGLKDRDANARFKAVRDLAKLGAEAAPAAKELCDAIAYDKDARVVASALQALEKVRPDLYKPVSTFLVDAEFGNRIEALRELEKLGVNAAAASGIVSSKLLLSSSNTKVVPAAFFELKCDALKAMGDIEPSALQSIRAVASPLNSSGADRSRAIQFLGEWARGDDKRAKGLIDGLKFGLSDRSLIVVLACIRASGTLGAEAKALLPAIQKLKLSSDKEIREAAEEAVTKLEKLP